MWCRSIVLGPVPVHCVSPAVHVGDDVDIQEATDADAAVAPQTNG
jgi:hypothetical protein